MDLKQHLLRQIAFSRATFGPGTRTKGLCDHIRKEIVEVTKGKGDADEWVDLVILALDGLTRELLFREAVIATSAPRDPEEVAAQACQMIRRKQGRNEGRQWPDWRTQSADKAIEHVRTPAERAAALRTVAKASVKTRKAKR